MVDVVNTIGGGTPVASTGQHTSRLSASSVDSSSLTSKDSSTTQASILSSRLYVDPTAGGILVNEQLNADGSIAQQVPSASVLAYLRNGLTIEGYPKQSTVV